LVNANTSTQKLKKWLIAKIGKEGQFTFSALDRNGVVLISGGSAVNMEIPQPDSIGFKAMDIMCKGK